MNTLLIILMLFCLFSIPITGSIYIAYRYGWKDMIKFWKFVYEDLKKHKNG
jgi:hypothetical protein